MKEEKLTTEEKFTIPKYRAKAVCDLVERGSLEAAPVIRGILNGTSKNSFGLAYCQASPITVDCAIVAASRLKELPEDIIQIIKTEYGDHTYTKEYFK